MIKYKEIELTAKVKLIISKELQSQIMFLHNKVGDIEWSGVLFHSVVSGNINDPENLILKAEKVFVQDIGSGTYTEFEVNEKILDFYDAYPQALTENWRPSLIHTHHSMATFFSGEDTSELHNNADKYNYYLSLIVNHKSQFCAKIAIAAKYNQPAGQYTFRGFDKEEVIQSKGTQSDVLMILNCDIEFEQNEFDVKQHEAIVIAKAEEAKAKSTAVYGKSYFPSWSYPRYDNDFGSSNANEWNKKLNDSITAYHQASLFDEVGISVPKYEISDLDVRKFIAGWLALDAATPELLTDVLARVNKLKDRAKDNFMFELELNLEYFIMEFFPGLPTGDETSLLLKIIDVLTKYSAFKITSDINNLLTIFLDDELIPTVVSKTPLKAKRKK